MDELIRGVCMAAASAAGRRHRIATRPHTSVAEKITDWRDGLDAWSSSPDDATAVRAVFDWSYVLLASEQARMFHRLGLHPGPDFSAHAAATLGGIDLTTTAHRPLDALVDTHLIESGAKRYPLVGHTAGRPRLARCRK